MSSIELCASWPMFAPCTSFIPEKNCQAYSEYLGLKQLLGFFPQLSKSPMDKLQLTGRNLGRVFNSRSGCMCAQTTLRFSPNSFHAPCYSLFAQSARDKPANTCRGNLETPWTVCSRSWSRVFLGWRWGRGLEAGPPSSKVAPRPPSRWPWSPMTRCQPSCLKYYVIK